jgi:ribosomal protein S18 acetylase RimI-like enzyme
MIIIFIIFVGILLYYLIKTKEEFSNNFENFNNNFKHPNLIKTCFSDNEINSFENYYKFSKIIYGKKSVCYLTPTNVLNDIPIISWNGYYINNFCVDKKYRNKGYATELLHKIINNSKREDKDHLILQVGDNNEEAKQLYYRMGFSDYLKGTDKENNIKLFLVKYL